MNDFLAEAYEDAIAIIGMAGRFPGASDLSQFWQNLCADVVATSFFTAEALIAMGHRPELVDQPNFVKAGTVLDQIGHFDAAFFGFTRRQAEHMDPQHRLFLECSWEALENAGIVPDTQPGAIGLYAGMSASAYHWLNLHATLDLATPMESLQVLISNDKDHLATTVAYKLNLTGPALTIQTACSTVTGKFQSTVSSWGT